MVEGGYDNFALLYSTHVTNPGWKKSSEHHENINLDVIRYGAYSSINRIEMKNPEPASNAKSQTKTGALLKHSSEQQPRPSKFKIRAELVKKALAITRMQMDAETQLNRLIELSELDDNLSPGSRKKLINQRQQIEYNIIQLDKDLNVAMVQIESIGQDIDVAVADQSEIDIIASTAEDVEQLRQLEGKLGQMHELNQRILEIVAQRDQIRKQEVREREQQLM